MILLDPKYEIIQKLSEGGMGAIYKVRHRLLDEIRVIKVMRPNAAADPELQRRFLREAKLATRLRHPNIAQLFDYSIDETGEAIIVMEFIDGVTLCDVLQSGEPPSVPLVVDIAVQTLQALAFLHSNGIVHRDISSDNVMLTSTFDRRPLAKLIDLGIAKAPGGDTTATVTGAFFGKARYSAPEQFDKEGASGLGPAADIYSFGVLFYEMLTGRLPIEGHWFAEYAAGHLFRPPTPFEQSDPANRVPPGLREAALRALDKDPARRVPSAEAFAEIIRPYGGLSGSDPAEVENLIARARSIAHSAGAVEPERESPGRDSAETPAPESLRTGPASPVSDVSLLTPMIDTVVDEMMVSFPAGSERELLEIIDLEKGRLAASRAKGRGAALAPDRVHEEQAAVAPPGPARGLRGLAMIPRYRLLLTLAAAGALVLGLLGMMLWNMRGREGDLFTEQIASVQKLPEDGLDALEFKLKRVAALVDLLPSGDDRRQILERDQGRLVHLRELRAVVDRLNNLLRDVRSGSIESGDGAQYAASLWDLLTRNRRTMAADDQTAAGFENEGRAALMEIATRTDSSDLRRLAEKPSSE